MDPELDVGASPLPARTAESDTVGVGVALSATLTLAAAVAVAVIDSDGVIEEEWEVDAVRVAVLERVGVRDDDRDRASTSVQLLAMRHSTNRANRVRLTMGSDPREGLRQQR